MAEYTIPTSIKFRVEELQVQDEVNAAVKQHLEEIKPKLADMAKRFADSMIESQLNKMLEARLRAELEYIVKEAIQSAIDLPAMKKQAKLLMKKSMAEMKDEALKD